MSPEERKRIASEFAQLAYYYHRQPMPDGVVSMYTQDVDDMPYVAVMDALRRLRRDPKRQRMPMPADVRRLVAPEPGTDHESEANAIAGAIVRSVGQFGYMRGGAAREHLGEVAWQVVEAKGGWRGICETLHAADTGFHAQCRDLARSFLLVGPVCRKKTLRPAINQAEKALPTSDPDGMARVQDILRRVL